MQCLYHVKGKMRSINHIPGGGGILKTILGRIDCTDRCVLPAASSRRQLDYEH